MAGLVGQTGFFPGDRRLRDLDFDATVCPYSIGRFFGSDSARFWRACRRSSPRAARQKTLRPDTALQDDGPTATALSQ
jgi:hypothetical protein